MELDEYSLKEIEETILLSYNGPFSKHHNYTDEKCLLELRQRILNHYALQHQKELLPVIIEFNDALRDALKEMYDRAHRIWNDVKGRTDYGEEIELTAECFLGPNYPPLHPIQGEDRQQLWDALCDSGWNPFYDTGVGHSLILPRDLNDSFDTFTGMDCLPPNWNEMLDPELTKDLHLITQFHNLFDHTNFALTDFIYVREFRSEIRIEIGRNGKI